MDGWFIVAYCCFISIIHHAYCSILGDGWWLICMAMALMVLMAMARSPYDHQHRECHSPQSLHGSQSILSQRLIPINHRIDLYWSILTLTSWIDDLISQYTPINHRIDPYYPLVN